MGACNVPLVFHGSVVLLLSQFAGYAFFRALNRPDAPSPKADMWRMSHAACSAGAILLFALGPVVPHLRLSERGGTLLVLTLIGSTYAFCLGTVVAGVSGHRGLQRQGPWTNRVVYLLYVAGAMGSTVAGVVLLYGAAGAYLE